jgi:hypothetical protein
MARRQRSSVVGVSCIPSLGASREPTSPPVANSNACKTNRLRLALQALGLYEIGETFREDLAWTGRSTTKNLRTSRCRLTGFEPDGTSATTRR